VSVAARVGRNTAVQVVGEVFSKLASAAFYIVMARELGRDGFGEFTFALSLALLLTTLSGFGTDALVTREVAREGGTHELFWPALRIKSAVGFVAVLVAIGVAAAGSWSTSTVVAVALLGVAALVELLSKTVYATFQGVEDMRPVALALLLQRVFTAAAGIAALVAGAGVVPVAGVYLAGALLAQLWAQQRLSRAGIRPARVRDRARTVGLLKQSLPLGLTTLLGTVLFRIDTTILALMKDDAAVGIYGAAYRLLETTLFLSYAFGAALLPALSRAGRDTSPSLADLFGAATKVVAATLVPLGLTFALFARPIVDLLYGDAYAPAATPLRLLGGAAAFYGLSYLASGTLIAGGRQRVLPWVTAAVMVQNIALNLIFIPRHSYDAAAAATSISEVTLAVAMTFFVLRLSGRISFVRIVAGPAVGAAAMLAVWAAGPETIAIAAAALAAYVLAALAVERALFPDDLRFLRDLRGGGGPSPPAVAGADALE
jgi:O-antigen/teichoic acid export membrane protein